MKKYMNYIEALEVLAQGCPIKNKKWSDNEYVYVDQNGNFQQVSRTIMSQSTTNTKNINIVFSELNNILEQCWERSKVILPGLYNYSYDDRKTIFLYSYGLWYEWESNENQWIKLTEEVVKTINKITPHPLELIKIGNYKPEEFAVKNVTTLSKVYNVKVI